MALSTNRTNYVNGLQVWPNEPRQNITQYVTPPTQRQLDLLEQAINACSYDWTRLQVIGLTYTSLQVYWVNPDYLYAGHVGTVPVGGGPSIMLPNGDRYPAAYAPLTRPHGNYGDYGGVQMDGGFTSLYLLNTLDQDQPPYGGPRFYMETVVRCLGLAATYWCFHRSASQRDRLARCFIPADRPDFEMPVATHPMDRGFLVPKGTPGSFAIIDSQTQQPTGEYFLRSSSEVDLRMYGTSQWYFESSGVESRMDPLGPQFTPSAFGPTGGPPEGSHRDTWGWAASPVVATHPWETRLFEAAAETFKDIFTDKSHRRLTNRTAVKLRPGRVAWDQFVSLYMDEVPGPPDPAGLYNYGAVAGGGFTYHPIRNPNPPPDQINVLDGAELHEGLTFYSIPLGLGTDQTPVTIEILPGHAGQYGKHFQWHAKLYWSGRAGNAATRPPAFDRDADGSTPASGAPLGALLPLRLVMPKSDFADTDLNISISGHTVGLPPAGFGVNPVAAADALQANNQDALYGTLAGQFGISQAPVFQFFKYRVLLPTKGHPRYPAGELRVDGADAGVRRNGRSRVGNDGATATTSVPPPRPPSGRSYGHSAWPARYGDQGTVKT